MTWSTTCGTRSTSIWLELDFAAHDRLETGQAMSRAGSDVRMVQMLLAFLPLMIGNLVMLVLSLVVMLILSPVLTAIALVVLPALAVASGRMRDRVFPATWAAQQRAADVAGVVDEAVSGVRVVKAFAGEEREVARLEAAARALYGAQLRNIRIQARLVPLIQVLPSLGMAALLLAGGRLVIDGAISLGTFLAFNTYLLQLAAPARMLSGLLSAGQMARAGAVRILELLDTRAEVVEPPDAEPVGEVEGAISFEDVRFDYGVTDDADDGAGAVARRLQPADPARENGWPSSGPAARGNPPSPCSCPGSTTPTAGG